MKLDIATFFFIAFAVMVGAFAATKTYDYTLKKGNEQTTE